MRLEIWGFLVPARPFNYVRQFHFLSSFSLALIRRFHERENLNRLLRLYRSDAGLEKFDHRANQRDVAVVCTGWRFALVSFGQAVVALVFAHNAFAPASPCSCAFNFSVGGRSSLNRLTSGSPYCE